MVGIIETPPGSGIYTAVEGAIETGLVVQTNGTPYTPQLRSDFRARTKPGRITHHSSATVAKKLEFAIYVRGLGYGPAEISLRPVFPIPVGSQTLARSTCGNRSEAAGGPVDSYRTLLVGRERFDAAAVPGRYGYEPQVLRRENRRMGSRRARTINSIQITGLDATTPDRGSRASRSGDAVQVFRISVARRQSLRVRHTARYVRPLLAWASIHGPAIL